MKTKTLINNYLQGIKTGTNDSKSLGIEGVVLRYLGNGVNTARVSLAYLLPISLGTKRVLLLQANLRNRQARRFTRQIEAMASKTMTIQPIWVQDVSEGAYVVDEIRNRLHNLVSSQQRSEVNQIEAKVLGIADKRNKKKELSELQAISQRIKELEQLRKEVLQYGN